MVVLVVWFVGEVYYFENVGEGFLFRFCCYVENMIIFGLVVSGF